ncbi:hypothetical protein BDN70DRAFT_873816 [Pholiota conissans]|uniref:Uncharacterized protein n=1 Tax=Pholiota conissans TaxID=109636 RepID=A0A9P5ZB68_9AGAR|nr:hypothetical protein BDN70DRAFT_873816 [Pholiota conissans]
MRLFQRPLPRCAVVAAVTASCLQIMSSAQASSHPRERVLCMARRYPRSIDPPIIVSQVTLHLCLCSISIPRARPPSMSLSTLIQSSDRTLDIRACVTARRAYVRTLRSMPLSFSRRHLPVPLQNSPHIHPSSPWSHSRSDFLTLSIEMSNP